jgi:hypothetical protein
MARTDERFFDLYLGKAPSSIGPAIMAQEIEPNDDIDLRFVTTQLFVGQAGNLNVLLRNAPAPVLLENVPAGTVFYVRARRILRNLTTAGAIIAFS